MYEVRFTIFFTMDTTNNNMLAAPVAGQVVQRNALSALTEQLGMTDFGELAGILKNTIMPKASDEEMAAFALVCSTYKLNPLTREVYAFPTKAGGIMPMIGIDGWLKIAHAHADFAGMAWAEGAEDNDRWCECTVWLKSTPEHPVTIREYLSECRQASSPVWAQRPKRMLRHRATIQAIRYAFGISGVADSDDWQEQGLEGSMQMREVRGKVVAESAPMRAGLPGHGLAAVAACERRRMKPKEGPSTPDTRTASGYAETTPLRSSEESEGAAKVESDAEKAGCLHPELYAAEERDVFAGMWPEGDEIPGLGK